MPAVSVVTLGPPNLSSLDRKSTRLNSSHQIISYAVFCLKKKNTRHKYSHQILAHPIFNGVTETESPPPTLVPCMRPALTTCRSTVHLAASHADVPVHIVH